MERVSRDGVKKRYRVRLVEVEPRPPSSIPGGSVPGSSVYLPQDSTGRCQPMEMEEVEVEEGDPDDKSYDPKVSGQLRTVANSCRQFWASADTCGQLRTATDSYRQM